jgi:hypothetical protein
VLLLLALWLVHLRPPELALLTEGIAKKIWQRFLLILLAREKVFFCGNVYLKTLEIDQELLF